MELRIDEYQLPAPISFNYEELKSELAVKLQTYETMVYTEDQVKEAKNDRARLNTLKKSLNDERLKREREYNEPFKVFKDRVNEIISMIDKPVAVIDKQIKAFEEDQKTEKRTQIGSLWENIEHPDWLTLPRLFNEKWLNKTATIKSIELELIDKVAQINKDLETIKALDSFAFEAEAEYKRTLDLAQAVAEGKRLAEIQKAKEEQARKAAEEAQKAAEEATRKAAEPKPEPPAPATEAVKVEETGFMQQISEEEPRMWVSFQAYMTVAQAKELKSFFEAHNIDFKAV